MKWNNNPNDLHIVASFVVSFGNEETMENKTKQAFAMQKENENENQMIQSTANTIINCNLFFLNTY